jgi:hypothetical protein
MKTYLVFFGSSDGFTFEAFDIETGDSESFKSRFKQFDQLDPKVLVTDDLNNQPVFGKYRITHSGTNLSMLKVYQCAQSNISSRIGGSNIGVALVSEKDIALNVQNLNLLKSFHQNFVKKALSNGKFMDKSIVSISQDLFLENKSALNQITFLNASMNNGLLVGNAVFVTKNVDTNKLEKINDLGTKYIRYYFCGDLNFVENALKTKTFIYYIEQNNRFVSSKELQEQRSKEEAQKQRNQQAANHYVSASNAKTTINEARNQKSDSNFELENLEDRISKANKHIFNQNVQIKRLKFMLIVSILLLFGYLIFSALSGSDDKKVKKSTTINPVVKTETTIVEVNKVKEYITSKDSVRLKSLAEFLQKISKECGIDGKIDSLLKHEKYKSIINDTHLN